MTKINRNQVLRCLNVLLLTLLFVSSEEVENIDSKNGDEVTNDWLEGLSSIGPHLGALLNLIFALHLLIQPDWMMYSLMRQYIDEGSPIVGSVLDVEDKANKPGVYLVEVCYQTHEHKYADNPSMRFRFPGSYDSKNFVRRFEFYRDVPAVGSSVVVLLPRGSLFPRSGCPREVVESTLHELENRRTRRVVILGIGISCIILVLALAMQQILIMEEQLAAWVALLGMCGLAEIMALLVCADQFMKRKCRTFDAARPMVNAAEQRDRLAEKERSNCKTVPPFSIPLHEFAGHARATERNR